MGRRRLEIALRRPFRLDLTAWALRRRAHNAVDRFDGRCYRRTLAVEGTIVDVAVRHEVGPGTDSLVVELTGRGSAPSRVTVDEAGRLVRRVLGVDRDLARFYEMAERDVRLTALAKRFEGMRPPRFPTVFEGVVNAIACQQLSLTVGIHLLNRLSERYGPSTGGSPRWAGFPDPEQLADADADELKLLGFSRAKARAIVTLADRVASGTLDLEGLEGTDDAEARAVLLGIPGVGRWSAEYTMLRGLGRLHVLPGDDVGARNNLRRRYGLDASAGYPELAGLAAAWSPYGGLVYLHLLLDALAEAGHVHPGGAQAVQGDL